MAKVAHYEEHERYVSVLLGGRVSRSSGRGKFDKGDGKNAEYLWDCKSTQQRRFSLTGSMLSKLVGQASGEGREPILPLRFLSSAGKVLADLVVVIDSVRPVLIAGCDFPKSKSITAGSVNACFSVRSDKFVFDVRVVDLDDMVEPDDKTQ